LPPTSASPGDADDRAAPEATAPAPDATADLCGEICPFTFVRTKLALEALPLGGVLRVIIDHAPAARTIPRSATEWGQEVLAVQPLEDGRWAIDLRRRVR
jgi:TusA-related sulfurtransferase